MRLEKKRRSAHLVVIDDLVHRIYDEADAEVTCQKFYLLLENYTSKLPKKHSQPDNHTQKDVFLITYPDQVTQPALSPLSTLGDFFTKYLTGWISAIHILPFFPSTSDDGFSIVDYKQIDPGLGTWEDIAAIGSQFRLMFDAVVNHTSSQSVWFRGFLNDDPDYMEYFIVVDPKADLSSVVRPRALPLLTEVHTKSGTKHVWTTFSTDQIDLNYQNPAVLLEMIDTILFYVAHGAEFIRLDAIAYLWKKVGTPCIHLPQTHTIIQLLHAILDEVAPHVSLITETNVPHEDNISYFGDGTNEAHLVYNFALPPLVLHTLRAGDASALSKWARNLQLPSNRVTFYNFLASHDGIGLNPVRGILNDEEIDALVVGISTCGGLVGYKNNADGTKSPYELNVNFYDALCMDTPEQADLFHVERFLAAHAILFALAGVPAIYFHSLFGSRGWPEGVDLTAQNRTINRQKCTLQALEAELQNPYSLRHRIFHALSKMIRNRTGNDAFHPTGEQKILDFGKGIFALLRISPTGKGDVLCVHNVTSRQHKINLDCAGLDLWRGNEFFDIIGDQIIRRDSRREMIMPPYQVLWLKNEKSGQGERGKSKKS